MRISRRPVIKAFAGLVAFIPAARALAASPSVQPDIPCDPCAYTYCGGYFYRCDGMGVLYRCQTCYDQCSNDPCTTTCTIYSRC